MRQSRGDLQDQIAAVLDPERRAKFEAIVKGGATPDDSAPGRVYIVGNDDTPTPVPVRLGPTDGSYTEVLAGDLKEGTGVIIGGGPRSAQEPAPARPRGPRLF
jgi:HlyD family secretion protein